jgi:hypothetical protein
VPLVLTVDQRSSSAGPDRVPAMLERLAPVPALRGFRRTAGDEFQGIIDDPDSLARASSRCCATGTGGSGSVSATSSRRCRSMPTRGAARRTSGPGRR